MSYHVEKYTNAFIRGSIAGGIVIGAIATLHVIGGKSIGMTAQDKALSVGKFILSGAYISGSAVATIDMAQDLIAKLFD